MLRLLKSLWGLLRMGPRRIYKERIKLPIICYIDSTLDLFHTQTQRGASSLKVVLFRGTLIALVVSLLVSLSIVMYMAFYFAYVPAVSHERPVHLQFDTCKQQQGGMCSFPKARVQLTKRQQLLMWGQPYRVELKLEMPESPTNKEIGMFMVCARFYSRNSDECEKWEKVCDKLVSSSCRSTMLHYRSYLLEMLDTAVYSTVYLTGLSEQKQNVHVELFSEFEEVESLAVTDMEIEIQSRQIQLYSAKVLITARFSGLRYLMYNWPVLSAAIGITSNIFFIAIVCIISWYQILHSDEYQQFRANKAKYDGKLDDRDVLDLDDDCGDIDNMKDD